MPVPDWSEWCRRAEDIELDGEAVIIKLPDGRRQRVVVALTGTSYEFRSVVARRDRLEMISDIELRAWRRNRSAQLVSLGFDAKGRLMAGAWVPLAGISSDEFLSCIRHVAVEADLFEYQLTGADRE